MGGSGGRYSPPIRDVVIPDKDLDDVKAQTRDEEYETGVNQELGELLKYFNNRDAKGMRDILDNIKDELADEIGEIVDLIYGGSVSRHTYVDGLSDTDALVVINSNEIEDITPENLKNQFAQRLGDIYGQQNVKIGDLAVTVTVDGREIQLLPAMRGGDGFQIAASDGQSWSKINPQAFATKLTQANQKQDGKLIPVIKLVKAVISGLPNQHRLTGYHVESLAIEAFENYNGRRTYKDMVTHFFDQAPNLVLRPILDRSGQSMHVDEYLGQAGSEKRQSASKALERERRKIRDSDTSKSKDGWIELIKGE